MANKRRRTKMCWNSSGTAVTCVLQFSDAQSIILDRWATVKVRECNNEVESEDESRASITQDILHKSTDFLRKIIAPSDGVRGVTLSYVCPHCHCFPLGDCIWRISSGHGDGNKKKKGNATCGVRLAAASTTGGRRPGSWSYKTARTTEKQQFSNTRHHKECVTI